MWEPECVEESTVQGGRLGSGGPRPGRARSVETDEEGESEQSVKVSRWEGGAGRGSVPALLHWVVERTRKNP